MDIKTLGVIISAAGLLCTIIVQLTRIANKYGKMEAQLEDVEKNGKTAWKGLSEDVEKLDKRLSDSERNIVNLKTDTVALTTLISQMQIKVDKIDQKLDRILENMR